MPTPVLPTQSALATVVASWREDAGVVRRRDPRSTVPEVLVRCADEVARVAADAITFLTEEEAMLRSGWTREKVRRHARLYEGGDSVRTDGRKFFLLAAIVPRRQHLSVIEHAAQEGAA
jgi:hypothetical protein